MESCNDCIHYEACKKLYQIAFKDFTNYIFVKACELYKPAADVAEVVRCKECVKRGTFDCVKSKGDYPTTTKNEEFCCWGERKADDD